jgi:hypothetical protein
MGGGEQQGTTASQQLLEQQRRNEAMANAIQQGFQQWGTAVARPITAPQLGGGQSPLAGYGQAAGAPQIPNVNLTPQGTRGGGISEQELAEILRQLGYGGASSLGG